jgi:hypothetical protein
MIDIKFTKRQNFDPISKMKQYEELENSKKDTDEKIANKEKQKDDDEK